MLVTSPPPLFMYPILTDHYDGIANGDANYWSRLLGETEP